MSFFGINPIKALAGIVQGFSDAIPDADRNAYYEQSPDYRAVGEQQVNECTGLGHNRGDVRSHDRTPSHPTQVIRWKTT
jgi:hypothetical protein